MSQELYFTADTHFQHKALVQFYRKQFASVGEMDEMLIERWNSKVKPGDRVYHLGDFALGSPAGAAAIRQRLHGQIYLIRGNHERVAEHRLVRDGFVWIKDYHRLKIGEQKIYLCHYAFRTWNCMHHGSWNLHGHSHGSLPDLGMRQMDVGVDCNDFVPLHYDEVVLRLRGRRIVVVDHHVPDEGEL